MFKKLMVLSCSFIAVSTFAMQMPGSLKEPFDKGSKLRTWVRNAKEIRVRVIKESTHLKIIEGTVLGIKLHNIQDDTTVLDIKQRFQQDEGVSVEQQSMYPVWPLWWTLGFLEGKAAKLDNNVHIKDAMNTYNTRLFELYLQLRPAQELQN